MQPVSSTLIPDGLLAAMALLSENPRLGLKSKTPALHPGHNVPNFTAAIGDSRSVASETRWSPEMGRFMSPDWSSDPSPVPWADLENPQSLNLYAYVNNNPLSRRDPNGHGCDPDASSTNANGDTVVTAGKCYVDLPLLSMAVGHHFVDQAITRSQGAWNSLAGQFFRRWTTGGPLKSPGVHTGYPKAARLNTQQIQSIVDKYKELSGRDMSQWTKQDIENVVQEVQNAGGDAGKFLADIAEENPTVRTVTADIQDVMGAAQSAYDASKGFVTNAAEDVEAACESEPNCGLPPP